MSTHGDAPAAPRSHLPRPSCRPRRPADGPRPVARHARRPSRARWTDATAALREHRRRQVEAQLFAGAAYRNADLIFATALGTPIEPGNLLRAWYAIRARAGVPELRLHDLRHAHATLLLAQRVHPKVVSERLGHASVNITLDTCSHVLSGLREAAAETLDGLLASPAPPDRVGNM